MLRWLQNYPRVLETLYDFTDRALKPFQRWLKPGGVVERTFIVTERIGKGAIFNCQMCGQCVLHSTGLTCPMNCPKTLRNGPCGGVRANGHCEVKPEMRCVWVKAVERSRKLPWSEEIHDLRPPVDNRLEGTSSWINYATKRDKVTPKGWRVQA